MTESEAHTRSTLTTVTIVRNDAVGLRATLDSVLVQSNPPEQIIVIDGASTDDTQHVIDEYREHIDVLVSEPDSGIYEAMNKGRSRATEDYLVFLNAGDTLPDSEVFDDVSSFATVADALYFGRTTVRGDNASWTWPNESVTAGTFRSWLRTHTPGHQATYYPRRVYTSLSINTRIPISGDTDYTRRAMRIAEDALFLDRVVARFELGGVSSQAKSYPLVMKHMRDRALVTYRHFPLGLLRAILAVISLNARFLLGQLTGKSFHKVLSGVRRHR